MKQVGGVQKRKSTACTFQSLCGVCVGGGGGRIISVKQVGGVQKQKSTACTVQSLCSVCECVCVFVGGRIISVKQVGGVQKQKSTACTVQSLCGVCECVCVFVGGRIISVKQVGGVQKQKSTACTVQSLCVVCGVCVFGRLGGGGEDYFSGTGGRGSETKEHSLHCPVTVCGLWCVYVCLGGWGGGRIISVEQVGGVQKQKSTACTVQSLT